jgi:hypothetical protein
VISKPDPKVWWGDGNRPPPRACAQPTIMPTAHANIAVRFITDARWFKGNVAF